MFLLIELRLTFTSYSR